MNTPTVWAFTFCVIATVHFIVQAALLRRDATCALTKIIGFPGWLAVPYLGILPSRAGFYPFVQALCSLLWAAVLTLLITRL
jgi:hypothetical protein